MKAAPTTKVGIKLNDSRGDQIPCGMIRTLVNTDRLGVDAEGNFDTRQLRSELKALGVDVVTRVGLQLGFQFATPGGIKAKLGAIFSGRANIYSLYKSYIDGPGDSRILRDGFHQDRLDWMIGHSQDGKWLRVEDYARMQAQTFSEEDVKGVPKAIRTSEFAAVIGILGQRDPATGELRVAVDDVKRLYADNELPRDWETRQRNHIGLLDFFLQMRQLAKARRAIEASQRGVEKAQGAASNPARQSAAGIRKAMGD